MGKCEAIQIGKERYEAGNKGTEYEVRSKTKANTDNYIRKKRSRDGRESMR